MTPNETDILRKEISELRREMQALRRWVIFSALSIAVLLFLPDLAGVAAESAKRFLGLSILGPVIAIASVALIGAAIVSHRSVPGADCAKGEDAKS